MDKSKTLFVKLSLKYSFAISVITKFEILAGITESQRDFWNSVFQKTLIIPLDEQEVEIAATILQDLKKRNQFIGIKDILIGSTTLSKGLKFATLNKKDFERITDIELIDE